VDRLHARRVAARVERVGALHRVVAEGEVGHRARERAEVVQARDERKAAAPRQAAEGRLQPEHAAQRARHADRSVRVGAERERHLAGGDCGARAARRSAGGAAQVVRVAASTDVAVLGREAVRELVHVERADKHGAGIAQALHQHRIGCGRRFAEQHLAACARGDALDVEQVLDRVWHAGECRQRLAARAFRVDGPGLATRALERAVGERVDLRVGRLDAGDAGVEHVLGAKLALAHGGRDLGRVQRGDHRRSSAGSLSGNGAGS